MGHMLRHRVSRRSANQSVLRSGCLRCSTSAVKAEDDTIRPGYGQHAVPRALAAISIVGRADVHDLNGGNGSQGRAPSGRAQLK